MRLRRVSSLGGPGWVLVVGLGATLGLAAIAWAQAGPQRAQEPSPQPEAFDPGPDRLPDGDELPRLELPQNIQFGPDPFGSETQIKPVPLEPIPDDPPPHEGNLIDLPYILEPPDLLVVEVLEALPGRPISGERLVRPDGKISLGFYGDIHVRGLSLVQVKEKIVLHLRRYLNDEYVGVLHYEIDENGDPTGLIRKIPPADSDRVFVDVSVYNSKFYYVEGDFNRPGRLPSTGGETVMDAVEYAGGIAPSGNPEDVRLYRPARGEAPAREYRIDLGAIRRGEKRANLQVFPGDRLIVGRKPLVEQRQAIDVVRAPVQTMLVDMITELSLRRMIDGHAPKATLRTGGSGPTLSFSLDTESPPLSAAEREALADEWATLWGRAVSRPGTGLDEDALRAMLLRFAGVGDETDKPE